MSRSGVLGQYPCTRYKYNDHQYSTTTSHMSTSLLMNSAPRLVLRQHAWAARTHRALADGPPHAARHRRGGPGVGSFAAPPQMVPRPNPPRGETQSRGQLARVEPLSEVWAVCLHFYYSHVYLCPLCKAVGSSPGWNRSVR